MVKLHKNSKIIFFHFKYTVDWIILLWDKVLTIHITRNGIWLLYKELHASSLLTSGCLQQQFPFRMNWVSSLWIEICTMPKPGDATMLVFPESLNYCPPTISVLRCQVSYRWAIIIYKKISLKLDLQTWIIAVLKNDYHLSIKT